MNNTIVKNANKGLKDAKKFSEQLATLEINGKKDSEEYQKLLTLYDTAIYVAENNLDKIGVDREHVEREAKALEPFQSIGSKENNDIIITVRTLNYLTNRKLDKTSYAVSSRCCDILSECSPNESNYALKVKAKYNYCFKHKELEQKAIFGKSSEDFENINNSAIRSVATETLMEIFEIKDDQIRDFGIDLLLYGEYLKAILSLCDKELKEELYEDLVADPEPGNIIAHAAVVEAFNYEYNAVNKKK